MYGDDEVFAALARLVAAGEYLDDRPGRVGVGLDLGPLSRAEQGARRRTYSRGTPEYAEALARGWLDPLPPLTPAPRAAVEEAEAAAGVALPPLLRRLYLELGNGGFGPGVGLIGLRGGHGNPAGVLPAPADPGEGPRIPLSLCDWGCGVTSLLDLADGQVWGVDPNPAPKGVSPLFGQRMDVAEWFGRWVDGRLRQPWLVEDPATGRWRGATDAEYAEAAG
ncbi:hypothetical protein K7640_20615 [Micromonospora sp. PLK6-60]|uniref:hypothetical protein n=1 Tax=Micromonospora sp. PLK6-60 TaxID=2873383 RepID=UPI001CA6D27A|nr:hypothetical protein [Micromonospora sp. PLK6-60]MBY8874236.1 hypothetical protein [Micromonospora sp. PLK6-60]